MTRFLTILATGSALALVSIAAPTTADARCRGCGIAAGVAAGVAVGAAVAASRGPYYDGAYAYDSGYVDAPAYGYYEAPAYSSDDYAYYGYRRYGGATSDYTNADRQLQGTR